MKKLTLIILTIIMIFSLGITTFADDTISDKVKLATPMADVLKELGVFKGSDKGYELERPITRAETMAIIVRLIGKEFEATKYTKNHNFTDVPEWANKYVAFSRDNGLTNGISETKFGSSNNVTTRQFLTFIYRALGYYVEYDEIFSFAEKNGLISEGEYTDNSNFTRADVVILINRVLNETYISSDCKVIDILTSPRVPETGFINTRGMGKNVGRWEVGTFSNKECLPLLDKSLSYEGSNNNFVMVMNDAEIEVITGNGKNTLYFK